MPNVLSMHFLNMLL